MISYLRGEGDSRVTKCVDDEIVTEKMGKSGGGMYSCDIQTFMWK